MAGSGAVFRGGGSGAVLGRFRGAVPGRGSGARFRGGSGAGFPKAESHMVRFDLRKCQEQQSIYLISKVPLLSARRPSKM